MFKIVDKSQLARILDTTEKEYHRNIKPIIKRDFRQELKQKEIDNPDIGLDEDDTMYLVDPYNSANLCSNERKNNHL